MSSTSESASKSPKKINKKKFVLDSTIRWADVESTEESEREKFVPKQIPIPKQPDHSYKINSNQSTNKHSDENNQKTFTPTTKPSYNTHKKRTISNSNRKRSVSSWQPNEEPTANSVNLTETTQLQCLPQEKTILYANALKQIKKFAEAKTSRNTNRKHRRIKRRTKK